MKLPPISDGMYGGNHELGFFKITADGKDFLIEWNFCGSPIKSAMYNSLNKDASQNQARKEVGKLISEIIRNEAVRILQSIPGPNEAMKESELYFKLADQWLNWAEFEAS